MHRFFGFEAACGICETIVEDHHDIRTKRGLNVNGLFWTQEVRAPIQVGLEADAVFIEIAQGTQAEYLVATAVGQDRAVPCHEAMQSSQLLDRLMSGSQKEVIRIAQ